MSPTSREFWNGVKAELPILVGVLPFGLIFGVVVRQLGLPAGPAQATSSIIFAGSSQFVAAQLFGQQASAIVILSTIFIVNLRHALYSAALAPHLRHLSRRWKLLLAYLLTDEAFAVAIVRFQQPDSGRDKHWFMLGSGLALWVTWQTATAVGIFLGAQIPAGWQLDFALPLTFIAIAIPAIRDRAAFVAAVTAGLVSILLTGAPFKLELILAALSGVIVGLVVESYNL